ncbi:MAG: VWA domain-containing protein [Aeromicrobium sp.]|uniref:vWA domain-containing protein n=1 Tax=Aeromicrobium sp. TaxID=1871063 RepID=UPI0039E2BA9B
MVVLSALSALSACGGGTGKRAAGEESGSEVPGTSTVVVLDASASMLADDAPGVRFEAARAAVTSLAEALPESHELGLVVYGTGTGTSDAELEAGCEDVSTLIEVAPLDKEEFVATVGEVVPQGFTPMGKALEEAAAALPEKGERSIVVVSDGEDHCGQQGFGKEPCEVARTLKGITVHTVGFKTTGNAAATEQLDCMAQETGGLALDAANPAQLEARLPAVLDPEWAESTMQPAGYRGVRPGMTAEEASAAAEAAGEELAEVAATGTVEVVYVDCTLVFADGVLVQVVPDGDEVTTIDGVGVGDDITVAEELYGVAGEPSRVTEDGTVVYPLDVDAGTGYEVTFTPSSTDEVAGEITKIILCLCMPEPEVEEFFFDPPINIAGPSDVERVTGADEEFKQLLLDLLAEMEDFGAEMGCDAMVEVEAYSTAGFAYGFAGSCDGDRQNWSKASGSWVSEYGGAQSPLECSTLRSLSWPPGVLGVTECLEEGTMDLGPYTG